MVRAGEAAGALDAVLARLADLMEKSAALRRKLVAAMAYPTLVIGVAGLILLALMTFVVPPFVRILQDFEAPMPWLTRIVLGVCLGIRSHFLLGLLGGVASVAGYRMLRRAPGVSMAIDRLRLRIPGFGSLTKKVAAARFSRTFGTLIGSGVPILHALSITRDTMGNLAMRHAISDVQERIRAGEPMAEPLENSECFPAMLAHMVRIGEETGLLDRMLIKIANSYDEEVDTTVSGLSSLIEPIVILLVGSAVGVVVLSLFLPLISIIMHVD
jgi:type IV pilus assembly protein PilC